MARRPASDDGLRQVPVPHRWLVAAAVVLGLAALAYFAVASRRYNLDLLVYRSGVRWWWQGHDPYHRVYTVHLLAFTYPPFALLLLSPLAALPQAVASPVWFVVNLGAVTATLVVVLRRLRWSGSVDLWLFAGCLACGSLFVLEPVRSTFDYGQVNAVIMLAVVVDLLGPVRRWRGALVGLAAAVKLTPFAFLLYFLLQRDLRAVGRALAAAAVATGLAWLVLPGPSRQFWTTYVWQPERTGKLSYPANLSWDAIVVRTGLTQGAAHALWAVAVLVTVAVGALAAWKCLRAGWDVAAVLMVAFTGLLVSPVSWSHHWIWVVLVVPLLLSGHQLTRGTRTVLGVLLVLVVLGPYWWFARGWPAATAEAVTPLWAFVVLVTVCVARVPVGPGAPSSPAAPDVAGSTRRPLTSRAPSAPG